MEAAQHPWPTLGVLLMRDGLVSKDELEAILDEQRDARQQRVSGRRLGEILIERGRVTPTQVARLVAEQYELPYVELDAQDVDVRIARRLDEDSARRFSAIPINVRPDGSLLLGIADPSTVLFSDELRRLLGAMPQFAVVGPEALAAALDVVYDPANDPAPKPVQIVEADVVVPESNAEPSATFFGPGRAVAHLWPPLGALLVREGLISDAELETALAQQRLSTSHRLGEILVERGVVSPSIIARLVAEQYELPFVELAEHEVDPVVARLLPQEMARAYPAVPIARRADGTLEVAIADPTNAFFSDDLHRALGVPVAFVVASPDAIEAVVTAVHAGTPRVEEGEAAPAETAAAPTWSDALAPREDDEGPVLEPEASDQNEVVLEEQPPEDAHDESQAAATEQDELVSALLAQAAPPDSPAEVAGETSLETEAATEPETSEEAPAADDEAVEQPLVISLAERLEPVVYQEQPEEPQEAAAEPEDEATEGDPEPFAPVVELAEPPALPAWLVEEPSTGSTQEHEDEAELDDEPPAPILALAPVPETMALVEPPTTAPELDAEADVEERQDEVEEWAEPEFEAEPGEPARSSSLVEDALALGATALHVSPLDDTLVVRARVDGVVRDVGTVSFDERDALLDELGEAGLDVRVLPTKRGDKITARRTQAEAGPQTLDELGLSPEADEALRAALARPLGVTVVCGPTASGVTTTLYAALRELRTNERIVAAVERSVLRLLDGVDHVEIAGNVTFAAALESLVAADSDVVLVGELPDAETAAAAFRAALSGRRVLTSLRMPDAVTALRRLADLGVAPTVVSAALTCVVAQQLVRRVCADCRETYYASEPELASLGDAASSTGPRLLVRGRGCPSCGGTGYRGRTGVFEILAPDGALVDLAASGATLAELERAALELGFRTLRDEATRLCLDGATTSDEVRRVFGSS